MFLKRTFIGAPEIGRLRLSDLFPGIIVELVGATKDQMVL